jgi:ATP-dependent helicase/nuclease subunit A
VDTVCGPERPTRVGGALEHKAFFAERPGRVDLWPVVPSASRARISRGAIRRTCLGEEHHYAVLAKRWPHRLHEMLHDERPVIEVDKDIRARSRRETS